MKGRQDGGNGGDGNESNKDKKGSDSPQAVTGEGSKPLLLPRCRKEMLSNPKSEATTAEADFACPPISPPFSAHS